MAYRDRDLHFLSPGETNLDLLSDREESFGLLVLDGWITLELTAGRAQVAWLFGSGDVIRPWEMNEPPFSAGSHWRAIGWARVLPLNGGYYHRARRDAALMKSVVESAAQTAKWLATKSLIVSAPTIEERLLLLFARYGERWGRVTSRGILIELPLTHALLAKLCGATRPSVTCAMGSLLDRRFLIEASRRAIVLNRRPTPEAGFSCWQHYASALGLEPQSGVADPNHVAIRVPAAVPT